MQHLFCAHQGSPISDLLNFLFGNLLIIFQCFRLSTYIALEAKFRIPNKNFYFWVLDYRFMIHVGLHEKRNLFIDWKSVTLRYIKNHTKASFCAPLNRCHAASGISRKRVSDFLADSAILLHSKERQRFGSSQRFYIHGLYPIWIKIVETSLAKGVCQNVALLISAARGRS